MTKAWELSDAELEGFKANGRRFVGSGQCSRLNVVSDGTLQATNAMRAACAGSPQEARLAVVSYLDDLRAISAPFAAMELAKGIANGSLADSAGSERSERPALGLVYNATSINDPLKSLSRPGRNKFLINKDATRVKRMRTTVGHSARLLHFDAHQERHAQRWNKKFITLTYRPGVNWSPGHITKFSKALWHFCRKLGSRARFVWVAELQEARNVLHYHVVLWLPKGKFIPKPDECGWWPHGASNVVTAYNPIAYIAKYASKTTVAQAAFYPKGARMHGVAGLETEARRHVRYWMAPIWVREVLSGRADIRKVVGGYMDKFTGEFLPSPWKVLLGPGGQVWAYRIDQSELTQ